MPGAGRPAETRRTSTLWSRRAAVTGIAASVAGCTTSFDAGGLFSGGASPPARLDPAPTGATGTVGSTGTGNVKAGLILPLSAGGNAGAAGQAMRNAAEMALAEFNAADIRLLVKDDSGTGPGARLAAQQALDEGAEILLGPLFANAVPGARQAARGHGVPIIAFSTDTNVASAGVYLLSFLPEADVNRIVAFAASQGKRSFIALMPSNAYGTVVEGEFKQAVAGRNARVVALERYGEDKSRIGDMVRRIASAAKGADALFIADGGDGAVDVVSALASGGINVRQFALYGTQLWDDPRVFSNALLEGGWYPGPDPGGFRAFSERYRARYHQDPPRPAALAYDAVALVAALGKESASPRFSNEVLTNPSGFAGIDGVFRFRSDGTNQRSLAVLRVTSTGGQIVAPASRTFAAG
jgi:branched-chain amino acid transport system substrate-binding protein